MGVSYKMKKKFSDFASKLVNSSYKVEEANRIKGISLLRKISSSEIPCKRKVSLSSLGYSEPGNITFVFLSRQRQS